MPIAAGINGIDIFYERSGDGPPLFLLSGFSGDHTTWNGCRALLQSHFDVIAPDNRGAGQTSVPENEYTMAEMASDIAGLAAHLNIDRAFVIGSSMGGMMAQTLCHQYPTLVERCVLENTVAICQTPYLLTNEALLSLSSTPVDSTALIKLRLSWGMSYRYLAQPGMIDQLVELKLQNPHPFTPAGFMGQGAALLNFDSRPWLADIHTPTLVIGSDEDRIFLEKDVRFLAEMLANARYHGFIEVGHIPHIEQTEAYCNLVRDFFYQYA